MIHWQKFYAEVQSNTRIAGYNFKEFEFNVYVYFILSTFVVITKFFAY